MTKVKGLKNIKSLKRKIKEDNLREWYEKNPWAYRSNSYKHLYGEGERSLEDADYPGPGLEAMFWDIPNI